MCRQSVTPLRQPSALSVCLATYNGELFIENQIHTILADISSCDEVVVVDDASSDRTIAIIEAFRDPRIRIYTNPVNQGHVKTFERAIGLARGRYICLADQDDLWPLGRTSNMTNALKRFDVVAGQFSVFAIGGEVSTSNLRPVDSSHPLRNILGLAMGRREYFGCAMAFRSEIRRYLLPIPGYVEAHDHWLALSGNICGNLGHIDDTVVLRRIHDNNLTQSRRTLSSVARTRVIWVLSVTHLLLRHIISHR